MTTRAKFKILTKTTSEYSGVNYRFSAVAGDTDENKSFWRYTPSGTIDIYIENPDVKFEVGEEYYVDFTKAE